MCYRSWGAHCKGPPYSTSAAGFRATESEGVCERGALPWWASRGGRGGWGSGTRDCRALYRTMYISLALVSHAFSRSQSLYSSTAL